MRITRINVQDRRSLLEFIRFPRVLYGNTKWIQPLTREVARKINPAVSSFCKYGSVRLYVARSDDGEVCGRIAAITNPWHQRLHGDPAGFFGMFESIDDIRVAEALLHEACSYIKSNNYTSIMGPVNLTTNDETGFLLEGYQHYPTFMCGYSLPYYHRLMESCGLSKLVDTIAYETYWGHPFPKKYYRVIERARKNSHIRIRKFSRNTSARDIQQIRDVYNESFKSIWGFVPISEEEAQELGKELLQFADLDLVWLADYDNHPVGFILGFPDLNEILRHSGGRLGPLTLLRILFPRRSMRDMRVAAFGVLPAYRALGIEAALIWRVHERINNRPYRRIEFSVVMENNRRMRRLLEALGFTEAKRYRLYEMKL